MKNKKLSQATNITMKNGNYTIETSGQATIINKNPLKYKTGSTKETN